MGDGPFAGQRFSRSQEAGAFWCGYQGFAVPVDGKDAKEPKGWGGNGFCRRLTGGRGSRISGWFRRQSRVESRRMVQGAEGIPAGRSAFFAVFLAGKGADCTSSSGTGGKIGRTGVRNRYRTIPVPMQKKKSRTRSGKEREKVFGNETENMDGPPCDRVCILCPIIGNFPSLSYP